MRSSFWTVAMVVVDVIFEVEDGGQLWPVGVGGGGR